MKKFKIKTSFLKLAVASVIGFASLNVVNANFNSTFAEEVVDSKFNIVKKDGTLSSDFVTECYTDLYDDDCDANCNISLHSNKDANSVINGVENVRLEFFNVGGKTPVKTKIATCKHKKGYKKTVVSCEINKFEIKFGESYDIKFYDNNKPSNDENLLGTYRIDFLQPKKSSELKDFKFVVDNSEYSTNVSKGQTNEKISDRIRLPQLDEPLGSAKTDSLIIECLSNDNNEDSVFKNYNDLIVDVVDESGNVVLTKKMEKEEHFKGMDVLKSKVFKCGLSEIAFDKTYTLKFYDGKDDQKKNVLANFLFKSSEMGAIINNFLTAEKVFGKN